eukprot:5595632-Pyramimonas_sp.AAC.1
MWWCAGGHLQASADVVRCAPPARAAVADGAHKEAHKPHQRVLVHGVDVGHVRHTEEEHRN